jgi:hypothetical protein
MRKLFLFIALILTLCGSYSASAQAKDDPKKEAAKDYLFHKQMDGGIRIQTTGLDFFIQYGFIKNIYRTHLFMLDYEWHMDYRDKKIKSSPYYTPEGGRDYYFGVQNRFHVIRFSYGYEHALADKAARNGVRLSWVGFVGGALGLVKPYYLNLDYPGTDGRPVDVHTERYSAANAAVFLDQNRIDEAAPLYKGLDQISPVIGGHLRSGLNFDFGSRDAFVKALEAGASLDIFYKKIPIYTNDNSNHFLFLGFYLHFQLGKRW